LEKLWPGHVPPQQPDWPVQVALLKQMRFQAALGQKGVKKLPDELKQGLVKGHACRYTKRRQNSRYFRRHSDKQTSKSAVTFTVCLQENFLYRS
jgi:hypothetical protein